VLIARSVALRGFTRATGVDILRMADKDARKQVVDTDEADRRRNDRRKDASRTHGEDAARTTFSSAATRIFERSKVLARGALEYQFVDFL